MELEFEKEKVPYLGTPVREVQNVEATQELKLPDGLPDVGRILASWGQEILRGKEWRMDSILLTGGVMVWVLYVPEEGGAAQILNTWIPFQMKWDLPEDTQEGRIRTKCLTRFVDARSVSPRKVMVRCGVGALAEAMVPEETEISRPGKTPEGVELLRSRYPVVLPREAGEKAFFLEEELTPVGAEKVLYYTLSPQIQEPKVMGNKIAFRGNGNLHVLYIGEDGEVSSQDFLLPFSQFAELEGSYGTDAQANMLPAVTELELELDDEGKLRLKAGLLGQYVVEEPSVLETVEDAYSIGRELNMERGEANLPATSDSRNENIFGEQTVSAQGGREVDTRILPDFPRQRRTENGMNLVFPGSFQTLYYGEDGVLQSAGGRFETERNIRADEAARVTAFPEKPGEPQVSFGNGSMSFQVEIPVHIATEAGRGIPMVMGLELGEEQARNPDRPSIILRRSDGARLWDMAKKAGSTVEAIRKANALEGEPASGQMLLIPVS